MDKTEVKVMKKILSANDKIAKELRYDLTKKRINFMIECIFTLDYEIYGNGQGSLKELVYDPAEKLKAIFQKWDSHFVLFVEAAELEMIEAQGSDDAIHMVKQQILLFPLFQLFVDLM